ncbi:MAG: right-handed parallel beta-helix repeat-containing protein [Candidatus Eisenbacteria bacterium]|uniref:Right-handed parallel beta-helix repeat-containing protein n=1 Tax=Eiseniibacteriota bacterium TaxID=2212470 RepID=A0A956NGV6_UNCEI|nr:right-handed parallel beta-helix repeat-containing protein [Candidatus Eisenbacteria bacterium]
MPKRLESLGNLVAVSMAVASAAVVTAGTAYGQTTWDGGGDGASWSDGANWSPDGVPDSMTDVLLDGGVSIVIDVESSTRDLTLTNAALDGPGNLTVAGHMDWFQGTVEGGGVLTVTGSITFLEGPDKIIGRQIELICDAVWQDSHIFFDIPAGGAVHHQAGYQFTIEEAAEPNRPGYGARSQASHRSAPLVGEDPTADDTDVYLFDFDGTLVSNTTVVQEVSTRIGGDFVQAAGTITFGSGSLLDVGAIYMMGNGTGAILDEGTHLVEGQLQQISGETTDGVTLTGDQTIYILDPEGVADTPFSVQGSIQLGDGAQIDAPMDIDAATTFSGATASIDRINVQQSSIALLEFLGIQLAIGELVWENGQIRLGDGATINADTVRIDQVNTNLQMTGDGDPAETESLVVSQLFVVQQTGSVPPRTDVFVGFPNGTRFETESSTEFVFLGGGTFGGEVRLGTGSTLKLRQGEYDIASSSTFSGAGQLFVEMNASVSIESPTVEDELEARLLGTLLPLGINDLDNLRLRVDGGRIVGSSSDALRCKVEFAPESSVRRASIEGLELGLQSGSKWTNGHIDLKNGATVRVPAGSDFIVSHTATNLQVTEDANTGTEERWVVEGTNTIDQSASVPASYNVPTTVSPGGRFVVEPGQNVTVPNAMTVLGKLMLRGDAGIKFLFVDSEIAPGGCVAGTGTVTQSSNGKLLLNGIVSPGENPGDIGDIEFTGPTLFGPSSVSEVDFQKVNENPLQNDLIRFPGATSLTGTLRARVDATGPINETVTIAEGSSVSGEWAMVEVEGESQVALIYTQNSVDATVTRSASTNLIIGVVVLDVDGRGADSPVNPTLDGISVELVDPNGVVLEQTVTADGGFRFERMLEPGRYAVRVVLSPEEYVPSIPESGEVSVLINETVVNGLASFGIRRPTERFTVSTLDPDGPGSLRAAIEAANLSESPWVEIEFVGIGGAIPFGSSLPILEKPTRLIASGGGAALIGGSPLVGESLFAGEAPTITLDGTNCTDCDGLVFAGGESSVRGFAIENFSGYGIVLEQSDLQFVSSCRIASNGAGGVLIRSGDDNRVGGEAEADRNEITGNGGAGIAVLGGTGHDLRGNSIFANAGLAVDIGADGPTPNDSRDADVGPNDLQNAPVLTDADPFGLTVSGSLESRPFSEYVIEVYGSEVCPGNGFGDAQLLLGSATVVTDDHGLADFIVDTVPYVGELSAIATSLDGSTSEVSPCLMSVVTDVTDVHLPISFAHYLHPNPSPGPTSLSLRIPHTDSVEASLHDVSGRRIAILFEGTLPSGHHEISWDGRGEGGRPVTNGVYFYKVRVGDAEGRGRIVIIE